MLHAGSKMERPSSFVLWVLQDEGINFGGQEMMQDLEGLDFSERGNIWKRGGN